MFYDGGCCVVLWSVINCNLDEDDMRKGVVYEHWRYDKHQQTYLHNKVREKEVEISSLPVSLVKELITSVIFYQTIKNEGRNNNYNKATQRWIFWVNLSPVGFITLEYAHLIRLWSVKIWIIRCFCQNNIIV